MKQTHIVLDLLLPPRQDAAEAVHPTVRPLNDPAASLETGLVLYGLRFFAASPDMGRIPELLCQVPSLLVVVSFVQTQALRIPPRRLRPLVRDALQRSLHYLEVIAIGSLD